jgi:hypothetical protein
MKKLITIAAALAFAGTATADDMAKKAPDAKKAPEPKKEEKKPDAAKMEMPKPAPELADMAKNMVGTWKCSGKAMDPSGTAMDFKNLTIKNTLDLEKFWIKGEMTGQIGPMKVRSIDYITYDAAQKKWFRVALDNHGGQETNWSADGKTWDGDMRMMGMLGKTKAVMEIKTPGKEWTLNAQMSADGKKWAPGFEMACKK